MYPYFSEGKHKRRPKVFKCYSLIRPCKTYSLNHYPKKVRNLGKFGAVNRHCGFKPFRERHKYWHFFLIGRRRFILRDI